MQAAEDGGGRRLAVGDVSALRAALHPLWPNPRAQAARERGEHLTGDADIESCIVDIDELPDARVAQAGGVSERHQAERRLADEGGGLVTHFEHLRDQLALHREHKIARQSAASQSWALLCCVLAGDEQGAPL